MKISINDTCRVLDGCIIPFVTAWEAVTYPDNALEAADDVPRRVHYTEMICKDWLSQLAHESEGAQEHSLDELLAIFTGMPSKSCLGALNAQLAEGKITEEEHSLYLRESTVMFQKFSEVVKDRVVEFCATEACRSAK